MRIPGDWSLPCEIAEDLEWEAQREAQDRLYEQMRADREAQLRADLVANEARWERLQQAEREAAEAAQQSREVNTEHHWRRRRSRARATYEPYTRQEVYDRDGGRCYMCDRRLAPGWHIEHVVPIARGGPDTFENVRASCPRCNRRKGLQAPVYRRSI